MLIKRFVAFIIDIYLGTLLATIPISFLSFQLTGEISQNVFLIEKNYALIGLFSSVIIMFLYFVIMPKILFSGSTLGKKLLGLEINTGIEGSFLKRQIVMMLTLTSLSNIIGQIIVFITGWNIINILNDFSRSIALISLGLIVFSKKHLAVHDMIAKTFVK